MNKNIILAYLLASLKNSWFWLGIWVFYYLKFTNYAGIGIIETVLISTMTLMEIPKLTLIFSFLFQASCQFLLAFASSFSFLLLAVFLGGLGLTLYSGSLEALVYDSLKEQKEEKKFSKVLANITTFQYIMMALTGTIGGFFYLTDSRLPFIASGVFYFVAFLLCFFLTEPKIDTLKLNLSNFFIQNQQGFKQLFTQVKIRQIVILLLIIGSMAVISDEMLNDVLAVEFGFKPEQLGIFIAAAISQISPKIIKSLSGLRGAALLGIFIGLSYLISPWAGIVLGGLTLLLRVSFQTIFNNLSSFTLNQFIESKDRATTLSSFNMLKIFRM